MFNACQMSIRVHRVHVHLVTSLLRGFRCLDGGCGCDGGRSRALSHLRTTALPAIQKRSFLCRHPPSLPPSLPPTYLPFPPPGVPSSFPRFFFSPHLDCFCLPRLHIPPPPIPLRSHAPFFPDTSLSTRLTPLLVAYLESSITCT